MCAIMDSWQRSTLVHAQVYKLCNAMPNSILYRRLISNEAIRLKKPFSWNEWCINPPEVQLLIILRTTVFYMVQSFKRLKKSFHCKWMWFNDLLIWSPATTTRSIYCNGIYTKWHTFTEYQNADKATDLQQANLITDEINEKETNDTEQSGTLITKNYSIS